MERAQAALHILDLEKGALVPVDTRGCGELADILPDATQPGNAAHLLLSRTGKLYRVRVPLQRGSAPAVPRLLKLSCKVTQVATGVDHLLLLVSGGRYAEPSILVCGSNRSGQLGLESRADQPTPFPLQPRLSTCRKRGRYRGAIASIYAGPMRSAACTTSGGLLIWGTGAGAADGSWLTTHGVFDGVHRALSVGLGKAHTAAVTSSGAVYWWGLHSLGSMEETVPRACEELAGHRIVSLVCNNASTFALSDAGLLFRWGIVAGPGGGRLRDIDFPALLPMEPHRFVRLILQRGTLARGAFNGRVFGVTEQLALVPVDTAEALPSPFAAKLALVAIGCASLTESSMACTNVPRGWATPRSAAGSGGAAHAQPHAASPPADDDDDATLTIHVRELELRWRAAPAWVALRWPKLRSLLVELNTRGEGEGDALSQRRGSTITIDAPRAVDAAEEAVLRSACEEAWCFVRSGARPRAGAAPADDAALERIAAAWGLDFVVGGADAATSVARARRRLHEIAAEAGVVRAAAAAAAAEEEAAAAAAVAAEDGDFDAIPLPISEEEAFAAGVDGGFWEMPAGCWRRTLREGEESESEAEEEEEEEAEIERAALARLALYDATVREAEARLHTAPGAPGGGAGRTPSKRKLRMSAVQKRRRKRLIFKHGKDAAMAKLAAEDEAAALGAAEAARRASSKATLYALCCGNVALRCTAPGAAEGVAFAAHRWMLRSALGAEWRARLTGVGEAREGALGDEADAERAAPLELELDPRVGWSRAPRAVAALLRWCADGELDFDVEAGGDGVEALLLLIASSPEHLALPSLGDAAAKWLWEHGAVTPGSALKSEAVSVAARCGALARRALLMAQATGETLAELCGCFGGDKREEVEAEADGARRSVRGGGYDGILSRRAALLRRRGRDAAAAAAARAAAAQQRGQGVSAAPAAPSAAPRRPAWGAGGTASRALRDARGEGQQGGDETQGGDSVEATESDEQGDEEGGSQGGDALLPE